MSPRSASSMAIFLKLTYVAYVVIAQNGEQACEDKGFNQNQCLAVGCCEWDSGECWSSVGANYCDFGDGGDVDGPLLDGVVGWADGEVVWSNPPDGWNSCGKVTTVFGAVICVSKKAWKNKAKCDHIAHVYYQLLDNDADGVPDDPTVLSQLVDKGYLLWVAANGNDSEQGGQWEAGQVQYTGIDEAVINSCDTPSNRGASATDRSTWPGAVNTNGNPGGCSNDRDATFEEIHHLITEAALKIYPELWGSTFSSDAGEALSAANGNCGWGFQGDYTNPSTGSCTGQFAYDDTTCDMACNVVEGIYWASISYVGGLYTTARTNEIKREWLMATPDKNMPINPVNVNNAKSLEEGSPALYALVSDTTSLGHAWLPAIMTDGVYKGDPEGGNPTSPPTPAPESTPTSSPSPSPTTDPTSAPSPTTTTEPTPAPSPSPTTEPTPAPSLITSCTEDENAEFLSTKTKKKGVVIQTCGWLASKNNPSKLCSKKVKANKNFQPPQNVCFKTCNSCSPCYENPKSKFFWKKKKGKKLYLTCKALGNRNDKKIEEICSGTVYNSAGGYRPAYLTCPSTCANSVGLSECQIAKIHNKDLL